MKLILLSPLLDTFFVPKGGRKCRLMLLFFDEIKKSHVALVVTRVVQTDRTTERCVTIFELNFDVVGKTNKGHKNEQNR